MINWIQGDQLIIEKEVYTFKYLELPSKLVFDNKGKKEVLSSELVNRMVKKGFWKQKVK